MVGWSSPTGRLYDINTKTYVGKIKHGPNEWGKIPALMILRSHDNEPFYRKGGEKEFLAYSGSKFMDKVENDYFPFENEIPEQWKSSTGFTYLRRGPGKWSIHLPTEAGGDVYEWVPITRRMEWIDNELYYFSGGEAVKYDGSEIQANVEQSSTGEPGDEIDPDLPDDPLPIKFANGERVINGRGYVFDNGKGRHDGKKLEGITFYAHENIIYYLRQRKNPENVKFSELITFQGSKAEQKLRQAQRRRGFMDGAPVDHLNRKLRHKPTFLDRYGWLIISITGIGIAGWWLHKSEMDKLLLQTGMKQFKKLKKLNKKKDKLEKREEEQEDKIEDVEEDIKETATKAGINVEPEPAGDLGF